RRILSTLQRPCVIENREVEDVDSAEDDQNNLPLQSNVFYVLLGLSNKEEHSADQIDAESQNAPRQQTMHTGIIDALDHSQNPQIHNDDDAEHQGQAHEMEGFQGRPSPYILGDESRNGAGHRQYSIARLPA